MFLLPISGRSSRYLVHLSRGYSDTMKVSTQPNFPNPKNSPLDINPNRPMQHQNSESLALKQQSDVRLSVTSTSKVMDFDSIPGPISLKILSKLWSFLPTVASHVAGSTIQLLLSIGSQLLWSGNMPLFGRFMSHYGPVVRLRGPFGGDVILISWPEDVNAVFSKEGRYPIRACLDSIEKYRLQHRKYKHCGPYLMVGPEWETFRRSVEQPLQVSLAHQIDKIDDVCDEFLERIRVIRNELEEVPSTFFKEIHKWGLECMCQVFLNKRFGFLDTAGLSMTSDSGQLLESFMGATQAIKRCEYGLHVWKFMNTPAWSSLVKHCDKIDLIFSKYIQRAQDSLRKKKDSNEKQFDLLEIMLLKNGMMNDDVMTILLDIMLIGVNATSHAVAFLLYHLSKHQKCQSKLYQEISRQPLKLTREGLTNLSYLQACIKESLRLKPPVPVLSRVLTEDTVVHNYNIPKGTSVIMTTCLSGWREEFFEDPLKFNPNRWLQSYEEIPKYASMPFGHGPKACLGKELAEIQIGMIVTKILRKYRVEYLYGDIQSTGRLLGAPKRSLNFRFVERFPITHNNDTYHNSN